MADNLRTREVQFDSEGGGKATGYEAQPETGAHAGVVVIQEYWGVNEHIKDVTRRLAREGYIALAPDLYHGRIAKNATEASAMMSALDREQALRELQGAVRFLEQNGARKVGVIGFCMGGSFALLLAAHSKAIRAAAPFYGHPPDPIDQVKNITAPLLFIAAGKDQWINADKVGQLRGAFQKYNVKAEIQVYPEADHAFFNDTRPEVYNPAAAQDAWRRALALFEANLKR